MKVRCLGFECVNMIEDTVTHGTCPQCVATEAVLMDAQAEKAVLDAAYVRACEVHGPCDYDSFKAAFCADHWCNKHAVGTGEGDICGQCEAEFDNYRAALNAEMLKHEYQLWFLCSKQYWFKCPVADFDSAKMLYHSLNAGSVTSVRIARYDPEQGCESVLHKFN